MHYSFIIIKILTKKQKHKNGGFQNHWKFLKDLTKYNISLQIIKDDELNVFSKIKKKDNLTIYWNKVYEPDVIAKGKKIRDVFLKNDISFKYFKGNILNEFQEVTKNDGTPFKVFTPFWRTAEQKYLSLAPTKNYQVKKRLKKKHSLKIVLSLKIFYLRKIGIKNLISIGIFLKTILKKF